MKRVLSLLVAGGVMLTVVALSGGQRRAEPQPDSEIKVDIEERNPWTHLRLENAAETFHFAIVSDRTGGTRPGVFAKAIEQVNRLGPAFVLSVGDLIEGFTRDDRELSAQWQEVDRAVRKLTMPFFYVPGNHDLTNPVQERHWRQRFGRRYYHFRYRQVLFLMLNADDPPGKDGGLSETQINFATRVLKENQDAAWTIVALHRPLSDRVCCPRPVRIGREFLFVFTPRSRFPPRVELSSPCRHVVCDQTEPAGGPNDGQLPAGA